ncbi:MAG: hypothetical protein IJR26_11865 [Bacteroidales bacterium]|nr:hypothetical protein [Bacteroidales bacterium]
MYYTHQQPPLGQPYGYYMPSLRGAWKLRCRRSGFPARPMQRKPTTSHWRSWEASPPTSHSAKV